MDNIVSGSTVAMQRPRDGWVYKSVSGQRLSKHVLTARQQILNNATVLLQQWNRLVIYVVRAERL
jgi:hypothetical protein